MTYDLVIKGGTVVDPANGVHELADVAVAEGRVSAIGPGIAADSPARVIDATGRLVTPGLIDLHTHIFRGVTYWGVDPTPIAARTGVTTWVDAGSAGALSMEGFAELVAARARPRVRAFVNISAIGLIAPDYELKNLDFCDPELLVRVHEQHEDLIVGVKVRMMSSTVGDNGLKPLDRARRAADRTGGVLMMHIAYGPPEVDECLPHLREGDVLTHCFTGFSMRILDERGELRESVRDAWERGVVMDVGHGSGGFSFEVAEPLIASGFAPHVISTDIHQLSVDGPMYDLPTCMGKCMALGMSLDDVVAATTVRPAQVIGLDHEIGSLTVGHQADIAIFEHQRGPVRYFDISMDSREGSDSLISVETLVAGETIEREPIPSPVPWVAEDFVWPASHAKLVRRQREEFKHS